MRLAKVPLIEFFTGFIEIVKNFPILKSFVEKTYVLGAIVVEIIIRWIWF